MPDWRIDDLPAQVRPHVTVNPDSGCWIWGGRVNRRGYGKIGNDSVHRMVYEWFVGPIPQDLDLDHVKARGCISKACCWPQHLEPVTRAENSRRNARRLRLRVSRTGARAMSAVELRQHWIGTLDEVEEHGTAVEIQRHDKPVAVIVSADWHEAATAFIGRTEEELRAFAKWQDRNAALRRARRVAGLRPKDSRVVHHIDGNPYNNDPANLEIREPNQ